MKKKLFILVTTLLAHTFWAQIGTVTTSEYIPESNSITDVGTLDPLFKNSFVFYMNHGITAFNQEFEFSLIDAKTYAVIKKIPLPVFKGYSRMDIRNHNDIYENTSRVIALKGNLVMLLTSDYGKKDAISVAKIPESFEVPAAPEFLFSYKDFTSLRYYINDTKTLCAFSHIEEVKKLKKKAFHYCIYDNNLKQLVNDSILFPTESLEQYKVFVYENGYAISKEDGLITRLSITDFKTKKSFTIDYGANKFYSVVEKIKQLPNSKIVVLGKYYSETVKKACKKGMRKTTVSMENEIEEDVYFEHQAAGKSEQQDLPKVVTSAVITNEGVCYAMVAQITVSGIRKFELVCIENSKNTWKRQLPIPSALSHYEMLNLNNKLYIAYLDFEGKKNTYDYNSYTYGEPSPSFPIMERDTYNSNITLLKADVTGGIKNQTIADTFYKNIIPYNGGFMAINQGINGQVFSKCKFLRISLGN